MSSLKVQPGLVLVCILCLESIATSQEPWQPTAQRRLDGWSTVRSTPQPQVSQVQQAMYQAPSFGGDSAGQPSLPNFPSGIFPAQSQFPAQAQYPAQAQFDNSQVLPPNSPITPTNIQSAPQSQFTTGGTRPLATTDLSNANYLRQSSNPTQTNAQPSTAIETRIRPIQQGYVTGPPFVSPAPAPRVGTFPTSPYQYGPYQLISYPGATAARPAQYQTQVAQQTAALPQNQPVVGIFPTSYQNCAPGVSGPSFPASGAVPSTFAPPTLPPNLTPGLYSPDNSGYTPLFSLGQENYNVLLGRGVIGQPTVYVPGQPVRNFLRYLSP